jgi:hypothetical protein
MRATANKVQGVDAAERAEFRRQIERLPATIRPTLNKQLDGWEELFPYEQNRYAKFMYGLSRLSEAELHTLADPLRALEGKMGVATWNYSVATETMENASLLARSPYYAEWRREVQSVFTGIEASARDASPAAAPRGRVVLLILPENLPITAIAAQKPWDARGVEFRVDGDARRVCELAVKGESGLPARLRAEGDAESADCWLIDADAKLGALLGEDAHPMSLLEYAALKRFRDEFLAEVNTVPRDLTVSDQILARIRHKSWEEWWPASLAGEARLRRFVVELFLSGNGALIFSNAFVQWCTSEALRRARPRLVVARFGLRPKPKPFTGIAIFENQQKISALHDVDDPAGSAVDAVILARYVWLSVLRYPEQEQTICVCVAESSGTAYVIAPEGMQPEWTHNRAVTPEEIHAWMSKRLED